MAAEGSVKAVVTALAANLGIAVVKFVELLVVATVAVGGEDDAARVATAIDEAEEAIREAVPIAKIIYIEPEVPAHTTQRDSGS
jgi:predicted NBD/HSP70 family sugar kinase